MRHLEDKIQIEAIKFCRASNRLKLAFHIENEGNKSVQQAVRSKRMGNLAGVPDLCIPIEWGRTVWIEVKTSKGRLSKNQEEVISKLRHAGHEVYVCYGLAELMGKLKELENVI